MKIKHLLLTCLVCTILLLTEQAFSQCGKHLTPTDPALYYVNDYTNTASVPSLYGGTFNTASFHALKIYGYNPASLTKKNVIVLYHGGSFKGGSMNDAELNDIAATLSATYGFEVILPNYYLDCSWKKDSSNVCHIGTTSVKVKGGHDLSKTILLALYDSRRLMNYLFTQADTMHINKNKIIVGGTSAGGMVAMNLKFIQAADIPLAFTGFTSAYTSSETVYDWTGSSLTYSYTWPVATGTGGNDISYQPKALLDFWGGLRDYNSSVLPIKLDYVTLAEAVPMLLFHGTNDGVIPFTYGSLAYSTDVTLNPPAFPLINGAKNIYDYLNSLSYTKLYLLKLNEGCHDPISEISNDCTNKLIKVSDFPLLINCFITTYTTYFSVNPALTDDLTCTGTSWNYSGITNPFATCTGVLKAESTDVDSGAYSYLFENSHLTVLGLPSNGSEVTITIFDLLGSVVAKTKVNSTEQISLDIKTVTPGIYLMQISHDGINNTEKILLQ